MEDLMTQKTHWVDEDLMVDQEEIRRVRDQMMEDLQERSGQVAVLEEVESLMVFRPEDQMEEHDQVEEWGQGLVQVVHLEECRVQCWSHLGELQWTAMRPNSLVERLGE